MPPDETTTPARAAKPKPCPICGKPPVPDSRPFCSERCRQVDLGRWLTGSYVIAARDDEDEDGDA